jgi:putative chitinase
MISDVHLSRILPRLPQARRDEYLPHLLGAMDEFEINTPLRAAAFVAQLAHESAEFTRFEENLNYSWQGLRAVFPKYFRTDAEAREFHRQPERIANRVYADRLGNGDEESGDGWRYRGRGPLQITGRENYQKYGGLLGLDLVADPARAAAPEVGFRTAALFWRRNGLNEMADGQQFKTITKRINGGFNGLEDRTRYYEAAKDALGAETTRGYGAAESDEDEGDDSALPRFTRGSEAVSAGDEDSDRETATKPAANRASAASAKIAKKAGAKKAGAKKSAKSAAKKAAAKEPVAKKAAAKKSGAKRSAKKGAKSAKGGEKKGAARK